MDIALGLASVAFLILANGFFVAGEFSLVAVDRERITQLAETGHRGAIGTLKGLRSLSFQLSGAQLGITITSLLVGFIAEPTIARALRPLIDLAGAPERTSIAVSITLALALATATQMVVGELIPKNLAIARPERVAFSVATPMRMVNAVLKPLILFLNSAANWTVRRLGIEPQEELIGVRSLEEIQLLLHSSLEGGALTEEEFSLLVRSASFRDKTAADVLVPRTSIVALDSTAPIADLVALALDSGHSRFPIYSEDIDDIVGVAHVKDCYSVALSERSRTRVTRIMQEPLAVPESRDLPSLLLEMRRKRKHLAVVLDEYGGTAGVVSIEDLVEEIVGEIEDEYDPAHARSVQDSGMPEGIHLLSGLLHPDEVRDASGFDMPPGPYDTLAGFLLSRFERIPRVGDHTTYEGWEFKVTEMGRNRINRVLVVAPPPSSDGGERA